MEYESLTREELIAEIQSRQKAAEETDERYNKLRHLVENTKDIVISSNAAGELTYISPQIKHLGLSPEEMIGRPALDFIVEEDKKRVYRDFRKTMQTGLEFPTAFRIKAKDGSAHWYEEYSSLQRDKSGENTGLIGVLRDISQRMETELSLKESETKYRNLVERSNDGICIAQDEVIKYCNRKFAGMLGYPMKDIIQKPFWKWVHRDYVKVLGESYQRFTQGVEDEQRHETVLINRDGTSLQVELNISVIKYEKRRAGLVFVRDIEPWKDSEEAHGRLQKLESVGLLAGGIAHDFNNLLTGIMGSVSLAKARTEPGSRNYQSLADVEKAAGKAKDLTYQLLTFAKGGEPIKETSSIPELVRDSATFPLSGSRVRATFIFPEDLWLADIDKGQISQVIQNLVINAEQAMPRGGTIRIEAENIICDENDSHEYAPGPGKYIKISVKDRGIGIKKDHLNKIFDPYFSTKQKGRGIGLTSVFSIIKRHEGFVDVDSGLGEGTTFSIYLPASGKATSGKETESRIISGRGHILFMDDEEVVRDIAEDMLDHLGYDVEFAVNGREAISRYEKALHTDCPYDAVILDLTIPGGMGGKEVAGILSAKYESFRGIVSSGFSNDPAMVECHKHGFCAVVKKPYRIEEISEALHKALMKK
ncbi:MAG: PAS domain S-box protein [bacterium]|nr:PAS domain S-box protein [bacterium]